MTVVDGRTWLEHLSQPECWQRLRGAVVGRVGVLVDSAPEIYPVNFAVEDGTIVFRTDAGSKLHGLDRTPSCCFEADGIDLVRRSGWSVLVKGRASEIVAADELRVVTALGLEVWNVSPKEHWIRIRPTEVTGRRIHGPLPEGQLSCA